SCWSRSGAVPTTDTRKITGERGEEEAARFLTRSGFSILERNVRTRAGEIDLVAKEGKTLVFVEGKTRPDMEGDTPQPAKAHRAGEVAPGLSQAKGAATGLLPLRRRLGDLQRRGRGQGHPPHPQRVLGIRLVGDRLRAGSCLARRSRRPAAPIYRGSRQ